MVADPGQLDVGGKLVAGMKMLGLDDEALGRLPAIDPADEQKVMAAVNANRGLHWKIVQRGFWTNGALNRSLANRKILDWLDETLGVG